MNRWLRIGRGRQSRSLVTLALPLACLLPFTVTAREDISNGGGDGDSQNGDPLDSNDFGSGGGSGERYQHDPNWPGIQSKPVTGPVIDGRRVLLIPVNQGGLLTFRLVIIDERVSTAEPHDAR